MRKHQEGDVVTRIIGGPLMTVEDARSDEFVNVVWFDTKGRVQRDVFAPHVLQRWVRADD